MGCLVSSAHRQNIEWRERGVIEQEVGENDEKWRGVDGKRIMKPLQRVF